MKLFLIAFAMMLIGAAANAEQNGVRGDAESIAAAERVLVNAGGREAWQSRQMDVEERGFLRSGEVVELRIRRDFVANARLIEGVTPTRQYILWISPGRGWSVRNGERRDLPPTELAVELNGFAQAPYFIYHRLAKNDPALRVELRDDASKLMVFGANEQILCWFELDGAGNTIAWGNYYDGEISQHYYGPFEDMGGANLPRWGAHIRGNWRFEYDRVRMRDSALEEPDMN